MTSTSDLESPKNEIQRAATFQSGILNLRDPLRRCVIVVLCGFALFLAEGAAAMVIHSRGMMIASIVFDGALLLAMGVYSTWVLWHNRRSAHRYNANLVNTISSCILTISMCMVLYPTIWYPALNGKVLRQEVQDLEVVNPPAIAWITINDRGDVAHFLDYPYPKGFMSDITGGFDANMTDCNTLPQDEILANHYCNCSEMFSPITDAPLANHKGGITYRSFSPEPEIIMNSTNATLVLQVYSDHNTSGTPRDWMQPGPMLLLMVFDSRLPMMDAFMGGLAAVTHIPVLAATKVVISPQYRIGWNRDPYYYYGMEATSIPSLNDICDVSREYITWCYTTTVIQFADLTRTVERRHLASSPGDIFAQVGGYFAFVQFLCWMVSGMALR